MSTEQTRFQNAYTHESNRRDAVANLAKFGTPLPKSFIHLPHSSDLLPQGVPASTGKRPLTERHPILDRDWRRNNVGRTIFTGLAALTGLGIVGTGVSLVAGRVNSENSFFDGQQSTKAANVSDFPTISVEAEPYAPLNSVSGIVEQENPGLNLNSATGVAIEEDVTKQLPSGNINYIQVGESINVPIVPKDK